MAEKELIESTGTFTHNKVDRENKVISGVAILGSASKNSFVKGRKRSYTKEALKGAVSYFAGAPVFIEHNLHEKGGKRVKDFAGELRNLQEGDPVRADWHVAEGFEWVFDRAERFSGQVGLSILATGKIVETKTEELVEGFVPGKQRSVDLVIGPSTVKSLFEQETGMSLEEENKKLTEQVKTLTEQVNAGKTPDSEVVRLENKLIEQQKLVEQLLSEKEVNEKMAKAEKMIAEAKVLRSDAFVSALIKCADEAEMKSLIEDRSKVSSARITSVGILGEQKEKEDLKKKFEAAL